MLFDKLIKYKLKSIKEINEIYKLIKMKYFLKLFKICFLVKLC